jgi:hypothetical protein
MAAARPVEVRPQGLKPAVMPGACAALKRPLFHGAADGCGEELGLCGSTGSRTLSKLNASERKSKSPAGGSGRSMRSIARLGIFAQAGAAEAEEITGAES